MYTLDTNAIIYYLKDDSEVVIFLDKILNQPSPIYIASVSEVELFGFSKLTVKEIEKIENILSTLSIIPLDSHLAKIAGFLRRKYKLKTPDSIIAATTIFTGSTLITRNIRDFKKIPKFSLQEV
ncbi:type II toxin-antitoxin system VapC family toxin [Patescibacteria group bacterium]|nr:type II toxin-antitoxin system VapC family toxin [Patescibacteria group bacterium]